MKKILHKKEWIIIGILIMLLSSVPFIIGGAVKMHEWDKPISIDNWLIYYATICGALIGGFITALGLYITVNQTREIQQENKLEQERNERKQFVSEIETLVGKYLAEIGFYFYDQASKSNRPDIKIDRSNAVMYYRILNIKLLRNNYAQDLISLLDEIHNEKCFFKEYEDKCRMDIFNEWESKLDELSASVMEFGESYINMIKVNKEYDYQTKDEILKKFFEIYKRLLDSEKQDNNLFEEYKKAFEILIKEYLKHKCNKKSKKIEKDTIAKSLKYSKNININKLVSRYNNILECEVSLDKELENKRLNNLKELIEITLKYIESDLNVEKYFHKTELS
ncbi:hypothetical protein WHY20_04295 [Clostridium perfringens]|uniref:hypothetical protein n=1 Tax=Clostridium perfringens TaxID=1502 RepID=UPI0030D3E289